MDRSTPLGPFPPVRKEARRRGLPAPRRRKDFADATQEKGALPQERPPLPAAFDSGPQEGPHERPPLGVPEQRGRRADQLASVGRGVSQVLLVEPRESLALLGEPCARRLAARERAPRAVV